MADNQANLKILVNEVKAKSSKAGLEMNAKKTKTMVLSKSKGITVHLEIDGVNIEQVKELKTWVQ